MKYNKLLLFLFFSYILFLSNVFAQECDLTLKSPFENIDAIKEKNIPSQLNLTTVTHFPKSLDKSGLPLIKIDSRLRLVVENFIDSKKAMIGDYFKAHVLEDLYMPVNPPELIVPKGAWVRGRISHLKRPNVFIMSGKIGLHLDELITPMGEIMLINAEIDIQSGFPNEHGLLEPLVIKGPAQKSDKNLTSDTISTNSLNIVSKLISGNLAALTLDSEHIALNKGQEIQIVLKKEVKLN